jgi:hypothetical protein
MSITVRSASSGNNDLVMGHDDAGPSQAQI